MWTLTNRTASQSSASTGGVLPRTWRYYFDDSEKSFSRIALFFFRIAAVRSSGAIGCGAARLTTCAWRGAGCGSPDDSCHQPAPSRGPSLPSPPVFRTFPRCARRPESTHVCFQADMARGRAQFRFEMTGWHSELRNGLVGNLFFMLRMNEGHRPVYHHVVKSPPVAKAVRAF